MKTVAVLLLMLQFGPRPPLAPAETLLEPELLKTIASAASAPPAVEAIAGSEADAGEILLTCAAGRCSDAQAAIQKLDASIKSKALSPPARTIRVVSTVDAGTATRARAAIHLSHAADRPIQVVRGLWSTAAISDEVVEIFARHASPAIELRPFEQIDQLPLASFGVPTTTIVTNPSMSNQTAATIAAQSAYFLATLPNAGAEALLSHLTVGAHARLAEDGRRAVAQMGNQQRASADVLIMFGQAIEREQRRMRSFERFMPQPVDPMLRSRIADMEKGITGVWTSMGITSSPFVPAAQRIRGRGGEDRRVPSRGSRDPLPTIEPPTAFLKFENADIIMLELGYFIDGARSISDIRDAVSAEFGSLPFAAVVDYFERLAKTGAIALK